MALTDSGQVRYSLKTPYRDGTTHIVLEPLDLMARLAALVRRCAGNPLLVSELVGALRAKYGVAVDDGFRLGTGGRGDDVRVLVGDGQRGRAVGTPSGVRCAAAAALQWQEEVEHGVSVSRRSDKTTTSDNHIAVDVHGGYWVVGAPGPSLHP